MLDPPLLGLPCCRVGSIELGSNGCVPGTAPGGCESKGARLKKNKSRCILLHPTSHCYSLQVFASLILLQTPSKPQTKRQHFLLPPGCVLL